MTFSCSATLLAVQLRRENVVLNRLLVQSGGAFDSSTDNPFTNKWGEGANAGIDYEGEWIVANKKPEYDEIFMKLNPMNGKIKGSEAKKVTLRLLNL